MKKVSLNFLILCFSLNIISCAKKRRDGCPTFYWFVANVGMTMICVTHEMGFAKNVADKVIFMDNGSIIEDCSKQEFFETERSERTKQFLDKILHD